MPIVRTDEKDVRYVRNRLRIYISAHKPVAIPCNSFFVPVLSGASLKKELDVNYIRDDFGVNISSKNNSYCELTVLYWAWKNRKDDFIGCFHYRRFLDLSRNHDVDTYGNHYIKSSDEWNDQEFGYTNENLSQILGEYDVVVGNKIDVTKMGYKNIRDHYVSQDFLHSRDLDTLLKVINELFPQYYDSAIAYLNSNLFVPCNLMIASKDFLESYCKWLFDILFRVEELIDISDYSISEARVLGHLGERLLGIFLLHDQKLKVFEAPIIFNKDPSPLQEVYVREEEIPIVLCTSSEFLPILSVTLESIRQTISETKRYAIFILHTKKIDKRPILASFRYSNNVRISFLCVSALLQDLRLPVNYHLSGETYYRLLLGKIFPGCQKVIYIDTDVIVLRDLADLFSFDLKDNIIAGVIDPDHAGQVNLIKSGVKKYTTEELGLKDPFTYVQAGVLLINPKEMERFINSEELISLAINKTFTYLDQDLLNCVFKDRISFLDPRWNVLVNCGGQRSKLISRAPARIEVDYLRSRSEPFIIHYAGYQKPWDYLSMDFAQEFWKVARSSVYYEELLVKSIRKSRQKQERYTIDGFKEYLKNKLPVDSHLRTILTVFYRKLMKRDG